MSIAYLKETAGLTFIQDNSKVVNIRKRRISTHQILHNGCKCSKNNVAFKVAFHLHLFVAVNTQVLVKSDSSSVRVSKSID